MVMMTTTMMAIMIMMTMIVRMRKTMMRPMMAMNKLCLVLVSVSEESTMVKLIPIMKTRSPPVRS